MRTKLILFLLVAVGVYGAGCASSSVNPAVPKAHTGYVDLYTDSAEDLSWEVAQMDAGNGRRKTVFSDVKPLPDKFLRLAFKPGDYQLQVTFLNRVIAEPAVFEVNVREGTVTPVLIRLEEAATSSVQTKQPNTGPNYHKFYGRRSKHGAYESQTLRITTQVQDPLPYRPKEQMPYAGSTSK